MGSEITRDFLVLVFFDVLDDKSKHLFSACTRKLNNFKNDSPVEALDDEGFPRVLGLHFLHHVVQLMVKLQHQRPHEHRSSFRGQNAVLE